MKFLELHLKGFGKFHDRTISFTDGINVIYGKNEAGKSTMHTFIRGMLFGIQPQRGRASKNDLYSKYEPWENGGTYEGSLRLEQNGHIYRIERSFQKNRKSLTIIDETAGKEIEPTRAFMDQLLCGLSETAYNNTISIGQLKSATDSSMVTELKNYIANMNTSGNMALNITKATEYLKKQKKALEAQLTPQAAKSYTTLLGEIKALEREIASPEYENQLPAYQKQRTDARTLSQQKQSEKELLLEKAVKGRQVLDQNQFSNQQSIDDYSAQTQDLYNEYLDLERAAGKKSRKVMTVLPLILCILGLGVSGYLLLSGTAADLSASFGVPPVLLPIGSAGLGLVFGLIGALTAFGTRRLKKELSLGSQALQETFRRHLGDSAISEEAMNAFTARMNDFKRLCTATETSEAAVQSLTREIAALQQTQTDCNEIIEKQQKNQWELEKKLELLANYKTQAEGLKNSRAENERISQEIMAIDLAQDTMTELSTSIRDSFGLHLNKTASDLIKGITGGIYTSMSIDENLNVFMNTPTKLVPIDQVSSGTMDQIYLALRLAAAKLIQDGKQEMPLIFDDSFVLYDDERLRTALKWLAASCKGQVLLFTCHQREAQMLTANQMVYNYIEL